MNTSSRKTSAILVMAICFTSADAQACGELMLRTLGTMRYHSYVTHHPAAILLYSHEAVADHPAADLVKLREKLEKVGHKVGMARGSDELGKALGTQHYDVLIAAASDMVGVASQLAKASREPTLIPVLDSGADERQMRARFPHLVDGNLNELLRAIEQSMKASET